MHRRLLKLTLLAAIATLALAGVANAQTVYTESNSPAGNAILAYYHSPGGLLIPNGAYPTGGLGTGANLGSQGAVVLSKNGKRLFAVNAAGNTVSMFAVDAFGHLQWKANAPSGGQTPISVTVDGQTVYVLNAGGTPNITGFSVGAKSLDPIPGSTRQLAPGDSGPAQVQFSPNGRQLVVTNKASNTIDSWLVGFDGLGPFATVTHSAGGTPFGFDFDTHGDVLVSEAAGSASSYSPLSTGGLSLITGPVSTNGQAAPCWLVASADGRFAYTANAGSGSISEFAIGKKGQLTLTGSPTQIGPGSHPLDEAAGSNGFLYDLVDGFHQLAAFRIDAATGALVQDASLGGLPAGAVGLATN
jgi:6-phosphogluconolactonase